MNQRLSKSRLLSPRPKGSSRDVEQRWRQIRASFFGNFKLPADGISLRRSDPGYPGALIYARERNFRLKLRQLQDWPFAFNDIGYPWSTPALS